MELRASTTNALRVAILPLQKEDSLHAHVHTSYMYPTSTSSPQSPLGRPSSSWSKQFLTAKQSYSFGMIDYVYALVSNLFHA